MAKRNLSNIMKQVQRLQEQMMRLQEELEQHRVEATAGGGMVTVVANGNQEILEIKIDPEVVDPDEVEMLEDLLVAAVNQARQKARELAEEEMGKLAGGLLPGLVGDLKIRGFNLL